VAERLRRIRPGQLLAQRRELLGQVRRRLSEQAQHELRERQNRLTTLQASLRLLGPEQVLSRGFSITSDAVTGKVLRQATEAKSGQRLKTRLKAGEIFSKVENK
jgi:exodeoxyribonuclease VII large subunit